MPRTAETASFKVFEAHIRALHAANIEAVQPYDAEDQRSEGISPLLHRGM